MLAPVTGSTATLERPGAAPRRVVHRSLHRAVVAVSGAAVVVLGLVLVPLPGPGWPIVFAGLTLLGTEFRWARVLTAAALRVVRPALARTRSAPRGIRGAVAVALVLAAAGPALLLAL